MRWLNRVARTLCLALGLLAIGVGPGWQAGATGNVLFISAAGTGATCSSASPCALETGLSLAVSGDRVEVVEGSGPFGTSSEPISAPVAVPAGVTLSGHSAAEPGEFVFQSATAAVVLEGGGTGGGISDVHVSNLGSGDTIQVAAAAVQEASVVRVIARSLGGGAGCVLNGEALLVDSVCVGSAGAEVTSGVGVSTAQRIVNATIIGSGSGIEVRAVGGDAVLPQISNSILQGEVTDVLASGADGQTEVALDHSNYASAEAQAGATVTAPGSPTNQTAEPLFVDAPGGNFREQSGSPTVDAGATAPESGNIDVAGNDRVLPGRILCSNTPPAVIDIGAYEFVPVAPPCLPPITEPGPEVVPPQPMVRLPRVVGLKPPAAVRRLHRLHLRVRLKSSAAACQGPKIRLVRAQKPRPGRVVPQGATAHLRLGCGLRPRG